MHHTSQGPFLSHRLISGALRFVNANWTDLKIKKEVFYGLFHIVVKNKIDDFAIFQSFNSPNHFLASICAWINLIKLTENTVYFPAFLLMYSFIAIYHISQIFGCVSPELGAHAMLKFLNSEGEDLGSCVICLSSLMTRNLDKPKATAFRTVRDCVSWSVQCSTICRHHIHVCFLANTFHY